MCQVKTEHFCVLTRDSVSNEDITLQCVDEDNLVATLHALCVDRRQCFKWGDAWCNG